MLKKIYTVGEITEYIKKTIEDANIKDVWVEGEISNFREAIGHYFFYLKDENAVLRCVMFSPSLPYSLKNGMKVILKGDVRVYEKKGIYQMYVKDIKIGGVGELFLKFIEIKEKLRKEGLFDERYKKKLPKIPRIVGVVTSPNGAAIKDIINVIKRRFPVKILLAPVRVQGEEASNEIADAIKKLNEDGRADVIIVGRGGGSWEDLWPFNTEKVARAIFSSHIPVISAVGHETDFTISDFVADARAATPSAAAELAVPDRRDIERNIMNMARRLAKAMDSERKRVSNLLQIVASSSVFKYPYELISDKIDECARLGEQLKDFWKARVERLKNHFAIIEEKLNSSNPYKILEKGYSIALLENGELFKSVDDVEVGDSLRIIVRDGEVKCKVKEKKK
ncbi:MAG: exodeoxyribonuclease VII large subunit [Thermoplasmata archaeon]|nr:MAG: exodeoxyribonuclease VII large subunit [Thermoplasmata archaeon]